MSTACTTASSSTNSLHMPRQSKIEFRPSHECSSALTSINTTTINRLSSAAVGHRTVFLNFGSYTFQKYMVSRTNNYYDDDDIQYTSTEFHLLPQFPITGDDLSGVVVRISLLTQVKRPQVPKSTNQPYNLIGTTTASSRSSYQGISTSELAGRKNNQTNPETYSLTYAIRISHLGL